MVAAVTVAEDTHPTMVPTVAVTASLYRDTLVGGVADRCDTVEDDCLFRWETTTIVYGEIQTVVPVTQLDLLRV